MTTMILANKAHGLLKRRISSTFGRRDDRNLPNGYMIPFLPVVYNHVLLSVDVHDNVDTLNHTIPCCRYPNAIFQHKS